MSNYTKVSMNLTQRDIQNAEKVAELFHSSTKADAVSTALGMMRSLGDLMKGKELLLRNKKGELERVVIPGLTDEK